MPPKPSTSASRGRPAMKAAASKKPGRARKEASDAASPSPPPADVEVIPSSDDEGEDKAAVTIPPALLTRMLHQFFEKEGTRISKDANAAVAQYVDVFVREAIARAAAENRGGFLEVEDLEKIAPQLLLDM